MMKINWNFFYLLSLPFIAISYLLIELTNDVLIYQGVARLADYYGSFPSNIDAAWEMKPVGNRLIHYFLYKFGTMFATFGTPEFAILIKSAAVILTFACCWYFAKSFKGREIPIFSVASIAMLTSINFVEMQAEWFAVLISLVCAGLLLRNELYAYALSGALFVFVFLLKGISGLLIVPVFCFIFIESTDFKDFSKKSAYAFSGFVFAGLTFFAMCLTIFPFALGDMAMAASLARVGQLSIDTMILSFLAPLPTIYLYLPAILFSVFLGAYITFSGHLPKDKRIAFVVMWGSAMIIPFVQGEFFLYHYVVVLLPGIFSFVVALRVFREYQITPFVVLSMVILWLFFTSIFGVITAGERDFYNRFGYPEEAEALLNISAEDSVLFLDPGSAPYYFRSNSSCRYSTPMPVQRHHPGWNLSGLPAYAEEYDCIMGYDGKFIITHDSWLGRGLPERQGIFDKIDRDYKKVWNKSWDIYEKG